MRVQDLYRKHQRLSEICNRYADMILMNPDSECNTELSREIFQKTYEEKHQTFFELIDEIQKLTKVDKETAKAMIYSEKFEALMSKTII